MLPLLLLLSSLPMAALAAVSPGQVGSSMTILGHDDLEGMASSRQEAVIVLSDKYHSKDAQAACSALGEQLWTPNQVDFLNYLTYQKEGPMYWVSDGRGGLDCYDITQNNQNQQRDVQRFKRWPGLKGCGNALPILCTNSAPVGNQTMQDNTAPWQVSVQTDSNATLVGYRDRWSFKFLGLHYADKPERWTYSSVHKPTGTESGLKLGSQCLQQYGGGSEDCLFINIITPSLPKNPKKKEQLKPVMFYIHGGAFTGGSGGDQGPGLSARGDVVLVTINYRLSALGMLALDDGKTNGNYGIGDQITALKWVQENIAYFGGDPSRVTILGQSAGAASVRAVVQSPEAQGLIAGAISQSNLAGTHEYASTYSLYYNISEEVKVIQPFLEAVGCGANVSDTLACLKKANATVMVSNPNAPRYVVVDGTIITTPQLNANGDGPAASVPFMNGYMRDDGAAFIGFPEPNVTVQEFFNTTQGLLLDQSVIDMFPNPNGPNMTQNVFNVSSQISQAEQFVCLDTAFSWSAAGHKVFPEIYQYQFNRSYQTTGYIPNAGCVAPITPGFPYGNPNEEYYKCHSGDIYYTFGLLAYAGVPLRDAGDLEFSQYIVDVWSSFARSANPNPDPAFLAARGFTNTTAQVNASPNQWMPVAGDFSTTGPVRNLQYPFSFNSADYVPYAAQDRCNALGLPIDFWEHRS